MISSLELVVCWCVLRPNTDYWRKHLCITKNVYGLLLVRMSWLPILTLVLIYHPSVPNILSGSTKDGVQVFVHARNAPYHWTTSPASKCILPKCLKVFLPPFYDVDLSFESLDFCVELGGPVEDRVFEDRNWYIAKHSSSWWCIFAWHQTKKEFGNYHFCVINSDNWRIEMRNSIDLSHHTLSHS